MTVNFSDLCLKLCITVLVFCMFSVDAKSQTELSGNFSSKYSSTAVVSISSDRVTVSDISGFSKNDTVLIIQMQGVVVNLLTFGRYHGTVGDPGEHEFLIIDDIIAPDEIVFRSQLRNAYDVQGKVQIVKVPYFNSAIVTGTLTVDPWDNNSGKGGVLAMIVGGSLGLNADIDVSGKGFKGGPASVGVGDCNVLLPYSYAHATDNNSGFKGESLANYGTPDGITNYPINPDYSKGRASNYNGGGGGIGKYSGGGGGSHKGKGGRGGFNDPSCPIPYEGGDESPSTGNDLQGWIIFGGGGGASTSASGSTGNGGDGGGIVIIITDSISSGGGRIFANGSKGGDGDIAGGAGGGGAGGTIALNFSNVGSENILFSANGGNGGDNNSNFGEGGGGGGGLIYLNKTAPANLVTQYNPGQPGNFPDNGAGDPGTSGETSEDFQPLLNGFLFNSIRSSITEDQVDSICFGLTPPKINGTTPVGGTQPYSFQWQRKTNLDLWNDPWNDISGATSKDYQPVIETDPAIDTIYYRRIVTDNTGIPIVDISKRVTIIVQPLITGNAISADQIICYNQVPPDQLVSADVLAGGNGIYNYTWMLSTDEGITYNLPGNEYSNEAYTSLALTTGTLFKRVVNSGRCEDHGNIVGITVLDTIKNNRILNLPPDVCFGAAFDDLEGSTTLGGDESYRYKWQSIINGDINNPVWIDAEGVNDQKNYNPVELSEEKVPYNEYIFRRIVYSGNNDVCSSISNAVLIKDYAHIQNNLIGSEQEICSGEAPLKLNGSEPENGNIYAWEKSISSTGPWEVIQDSAGRDLNPPVLYSDTFYRRIVSSPACTNISNVIGIDVHQPVTYNTISLLSGGTDTTICTSQVPNKLTGLIPSGGNGTNYSYQWMYSTDNINFNNVEGATNIVYSPPVLVESTYYKRLVISGQCESISPEVTVNVLPSIGNNVISADTTICIGTAPSALNCSNPTGGNNIYQFKWFEKIESGLWEEATGINNESGYHPPSLLVPTKYKRVVYSGNSCSDISNEVTINLHPALPTGVLTNYEDTTICEGSEVQLKINLTGTGPWDVFYSQNGSAGIKAVAASSRMTINLKPSTPAASESFVYTISRITDAFGCEASSLTGTKSATVYKVPVADAGPDQSVCGPVVNLEADPSFGTGQWIFPSFAITSPGNNPSLQVLIDTIPTLYHTTGSAVGRFYWEETNWLCKSIDSIDVTFFRKPSYISAGTDSLLYTMDQVFRLSQSQPLAWEEAIWSTVKGDGIISGNMISGLSNGTNVFNYKIFNGIETCSIEDILNIDVTDIQIPQGFSPNNDMFNNTFEILGLNLNDQVAELRIVNSAGSEVFSTTNLNGQTWTSWDGNDARGTSLPDGTYYYLLKIKSLLTGKVDPRSGYIILKRN